MPKLPLALILFTASTAFCQTQPQDPATLQSLLTEVHQLRQAIESMTFASQRVQIALYTLQMQDAALARATQHLDEAHNKCSAAEADRDHTSLRIQQMESGLASGSVPEAESKQIQSVLPQMKLEMETKTAAMQSCQAAEAQASTTFRSEQSKLTELQDRIARLDKALETQLRPDAK